MVLLSSNRNLSWALLAEVPILLATLGLLAWALHIMAHSLLLNSPSYGISYVFPPDQMYLYTLTQTVTGYRTSLVSPDVVTYTGTTFSKVGLDGHTSPDYTITQSTGTYDPLTYGIDPTGTKVRTVTESGFQQISHLVLNEKEEKPIPSPTLTTAPSLSMQARQATQSSDTTAVRLDWKDFWSISSSINSYQQYESVTVNRGFNGFFFEAGLDYIYKTGSTINDLPRIRGLTALIALALISIIGRLACTVAFFIMARSRDSKERKHIFFSIDGSRTSIHRKLAWLNIAFALLLLLTYIPFWAIYASWTHRSATVNKADAEFQTDPSLIQLSLDDLLSTAPWRGAPTALIVFWTLAVITSILTSLASLLVARQADRKVQKPVTVVQ